MATQLGIHNITTMTKLSLYHLWHYLRVSREQYCRDTATKQEKLKHTSYEVQSSSSYEGMVGVRGEGGYTPGYVNH